MFTLPTFGNIEISPMYQFLVIMYAAIFAVVLITNILTLIATFFVNHWPKKLGSKAITPPTNAE